MQSNYLIKNPAGAGLSVKGSALFRVREHDFGMRGRNLVNHAFNNRIAPGAEAVHATGSACHDVNRRERRNIHLPQIAVVVVRGDIRAWVLGLVLILRD